MKLLTRMALLFLTAFVLVMVVYAGYDTDIAYAVEGGNIYFDKTTGTVTYCDRSVTQAVIPSQIDGVSVTSIRGGISNVEFGGAFYKCTNLTSVEIPDGVTSIGYEAFYECSSLRSVEIPNSVTYIGDSAFYECGSLTNIHVASGNGDYASVDGILFDKNQTRLICYPAGKAELSYKIPDGVASIERGAFYKCARLTRVEIPDGATSIEDWAFYGCNSLTSVEIPNSVTSIGWSAFAGCSSLTSVKIPDGVTSIGDSAFYECSSLTSVEIPNSVTRIGGGAFYGCGSLASVNIPNSVTYIQGNVFHGCSSLTNIHVASGNENYASMNGILFNKNQTRLICYPAGKTALSYQIPDSVTSIGYEAFSGCSSLTSVEIPDSVTSIEDEAFYGCSSLTSVEIPDGVTSIGWSAFSGCNSLTSVEIPDGITSIGYEAFSGCSSLTSVEIPNSVTYIRDRAFYECSSLTDIHVARDNQNYASMDGILFNKDQTRLICYPAGKTELSYEIPDGVTFIAGGAFYKCSNLTSVEIPNGVTFILNSAFYGCSSLTSVEIPTSVTIIQDNTFSGCSSLTSVKIPNSVTSIEYAAFSGCSSLTSMEIPTSVTSIEGSVFSGCSSLTDIHVASGNEEYASMDGILFTKNRARLICYPAGKAELSYQIPNSVTSIESNAFSGCSNLIGVEIPNGVDSIGYNAFSDCDSLRDVYYSGNKAQWYAIYDISESRLISDTITIHYNASTPKLRILSAPTVNGHTISKTDLKNLTEISIPVSVSGDMPISVKVCVPFFDDSGRFLGMGFGSTSVDKNTASVTVPVTDNVSKAGKIAVMFMNADCRPLSPATSFEIPA